MLIKIPQGIGRLSSFALAFAGLAVFSHSAAAVEPTFYDSRGRAHKLIKSADEFVVEFERSEMEAGAARVRETGYSALTDVPWSKGNKRFQILKVDQTTRARRDQVRQVRGVKAVRPIYRFEGNENPILSSGRLVVRVRPEVTEAEAARMFEDYGLGDIQPFEGLEKVYSVRPVMDPDEDEVTCATALHLDDRTVWAHPDFIMPVERRQSVPEDPLYTIQWHLENTGQSGGDPDSDIDVFGAWAKSLGGDVTVGAFDDAFDVDHEDLRNNYTGTGQDPSDGSSDPRPKLIDDRHGTAVMGLIVGEANDRGVRGVAPNARFTASRGLNELLTNAETASVYTFARQQNIDVHNNSWGFVNTPDPPIVVDALETAFEEGRGGRGMVVLFSSGNDNELVSRGFELSTLPQVIGVGSTDAEDVRSEYSNFGPDIDIMAPSNGGVFFYGMVTTDNDDEAGYAEPGYNNNGFDDFGFPNLPDPSYTSDFGGTSAACPVASGVAALCLGVNPDLTATQVRCILEHTAEQVSTFDADYDTVTSRSFKYGYGRINADVATDAALESMTNGGLTWPDRVANVAVEGNVLSWTKNEDLRTVEIEGEDVTLGDSVTRVLVLQSTDAFAFDPNDYEGHFLVDALSGADCVGDEIDLTPGPGGICDSVADATGSGIFIIHNGTADSVTFNSTGSSTFAIFAANAIGRYSWGTFVDSNGNVIDGGEDIGGGGEDPGSGGGDDVIPPTGSEIPKITLSVSPGSGNSPLEVSFQANALSDTSIVANEWDFGDGTPVSTSRNVVHTYVTTTGTAQTYIATFTATDEEGDVGSRSYAISILADSSGGGGGSGEPITVEIRVETPGAPGSDRDRGTSPFGVNLSFDTENVPSGAVITSALWDLGDGTTATSLSVPHTYTNTGTAAITIPITLTLTFRDSFGQTLVANPATRLITIDPGSGVGTDDNDNVNEIPGGRNPTLGDQRFCGVASLYALPGLLLLAMVRRNRKL